MRRKKNIYNMKIQIVYLVTGGYKNYAEQFIRSVKYFAPVADKYITIISDGLREYDGYSDEYIKGINVVHIFDMIYPTVNVNKPLFINNVMMDDADYVFNIDADSQFKNVPNYDWSRLFEVMDDGFIIVPRHPCYLLYDDAIFQGIPKHKWIQNFFTTNLTERNPISASYIPDDEYLYVNSALWAGKHDVMINFDNKIIELTKKDLTRYPNGYRIPMYMDENYVNKITNDYLKGNSTEFKIDVQPYTTFYNFDAMPCDLVFLYQKNMKDFKFGRQ
jgi:hypothetical protein